MKERGLIFTAESVQGILAGRKTQTRRVCPLPIPGDKDCMYALSGEEWREKRAQQCPHGKPGDRLYVKEAYFATEFPQRPLICRETAVKTPNGYAQVFYRADSEKWGREPQAWRSPMFMPKWAARIWLEITEVRVQRLQEIGESDAIAEGIVKTCTYCYGLNEPVPGMRGGYAALWDDINEKRGCSWDSNCWVWALTFKRVDDAGCTTV